MLVSCLGLKKSLYIKKLFQCKCFYACMQETKFLFSLSKISVTKEESDHKQRLLFVIFCAFFQIKQFSFSEQCIFIFLSFVMQISAFSFFLHLSCKLSSFGKYMENDNLLFMISYPFIAEENAWKMIICCSQSVILSYQNVSITNKKTLCSTYKHKSICITIFFLIVL